MLKLKRAVTLAMQPEYTVMSTLVAGAQWRTSVSSGTRREARGPDRSCISGGAHSSVLTASCTKDRRLGRV